MDFFKKKDSGVPDVGKEEDLEVEKNSSGEADILEDDTLDSDEEKKDELEEEDFDLDDDSGENDGEDSDEDGDELEDEDSQETVEEKPKVKKAAKKKALKKKRISSKEINMPKAALSASVSSVAASERNKLEFQKISAKLESLSEVLKGHNEMFSQINQQIGELRGMIVKGEKSLSALEVKSARAVEVVEAVKPESIRSDYMKIDAKTQELSERIEANKIGMGEVMKEIKDIRRKAEVFIGTDSILRLNEDVKKDMVEIKKIDARVRANASKSEQFFVELEKGFAENDKLNEVFNNLDNAYSSLQGRVDKLKIDLSTIVRQSDLDKLKKQLQNKLSEIDSRLSQIRILEEENEGLAQVIEKVLNLSRQNEEDLERIAVAVGDDEIEKVSDYEKRFDLILTIMDEVTSGMVELKRKVNTEERRIKDIVKKGKEKNSANKRGVDANFLGISESKINKWNEKLTSHLQNPIVSSHEVKNPVSRVEKDKNEDPWDNEDETTKEAVEVVSKGKSLKFPSKTRILKKKAGVDNDFDKLNDSDFFSKIEEMRTEIKGLKKSRERLSKSFLKKAKKRKKGKKGKKVLVEEDDVLFEKKASKKKVARKSSRKKK